MSTQSRDIPGQPSTDVSAQRANGHLSDRYRVTNRMSFHDKRVPGWVAPVGIFVILAIWQGITGAGWIPPADLPSPLSILQAAVSMAVSGDLWTNLGASLGRIVSGYLIGALTGVLFGLWLGFSRLTDRIGMPIASALYPIPKIAIIPLIILWVGTGESSKIAVIAAEVLFPTLFSTYTAVRNTDVTLIRAAVSFGATRQTVVWKVILPAALPTVFGGLRIAAGLSLLVLVAAEMIGAQHGIGAMILEYSSLMETANVLVGVVILSVLGLLINKGLAVLERRLLPWKQ